MRGRRRRITNVASAAALTALALVAVSGADGRSGALPPVEPAEVFVEPTFEELQATGLAPLPHARLRLEAVRTAGAAAAVVGDRRLWPALDRRSNNLYMKYFTLRVGRDVHRGVGRQRRRRDLEGARVPPGRLSQRRSRPDLRCPGADARSAVRRHDLPAGVDGIQRAHPPGRNPCAAAGALRARSGLLHGRRAARGRTRRQHPRRGLLRRQRARGRGRCVRPVSRRPGRPQRDHGRRRRLAPPDGRESSAQSRSRRLLQEPRRSSVPDRGDVRA